MNQNKMKIAVNFASPVGRVLTNGQESGGKGLAHNDGVQKIINNNGGSATFISSPMNPMQPVMKDKPSFSSVEEMYNKMMAGSKKEQMPMGMLKAKHNSQK